jgi:REP element-mobilizing transposase RayT
MRSVIVVSPIKLCEQNSEWKGKIGMASHKSFEKLPQRKSMRAKHHNYGWSATYLITILAKDRERFFVIPTLHTILETTWQTLPEHFEGLTLDEFVIMPDHIHFIIHLEGNVQKPALLGDVIRVYKSLASHRWVQHLKSINATGIYTGRIWHRNYHERIIRDQQELCIKRFYVCNNPLKVINCFLHRP